MPENDFLAIAIGGVPNVIDQADFAAAIETEQGFAIGEAPPSPLFNKMIRQASTIAAAIAQFLVINTGQDVLDNGHPEVIAALLLSATRIKLLADTTFYVSTAGSDANGDGTALNPWATLQFAYNMIQSKYDLLGFKVTIQLANGAYAGFSAFAALFGANDGILSMTIQGNAGAPTAVTITSRITFDAGAIGTFQNIKTTGADTAFQSSGGAQIACGPGMTIANTGSLHLYASGGGISMQNDYTISGGGVSHIGAIGTGPGFYLGGGINVTISAAVAFSQGFASLQELAQLHCSGVVNFVNPGNVTATKYNATFNSVIYLSGTTLPGNVAGTTSTGGQVA